jgi:hypothetical protein
MTQNSSFVADVLILAGAEDRATAALGDFDRRISGVSALAVALGRLIGGAGLDSDVTAAVIECAVDSIYQGAAEARARVVKPRAGGKP